MINKELLDKLVCPEDRTPLAMADQQLIDRVNDAIAQGHLTNRSGESLREPLETGLVRADGKILYVVTDDIPNLLIDKSIDLEEALGPQ